MKILSVVLRDVVNVQTNRMTNKRPAFHNLFRGDNDNNNDENNGNKMLNPEKVLQSPPKNRADSDARVWSGDFCRYI